MIGAILLLAISTVTAGATEAAEEKEKLRGINWLGYNEALSMARDFGKPVYIHFTAPWCKWCKKMQKETYTDPAVITYLSEKFAAVYVDTEKLPSLARKYQVSSLPTLWFLDSAGKGLTAIEGYVGPEKLLRVLEYVSTKAYEEVDYDRWLHQQKKK